MNRPITFTATLFLMAIAARAQTFDSGNHYARVPHVVASGSPSLVNFDVASDAELSVIAFEEMATGSILASLTDGRGLAPDASVGSGWSVPAAISSGPPANRVLGKDSVFVDRDAAVVLWLEDVSGPATTRVACAAYASGSWSPAIVINDPLLPPTADVLGYAAVAKRGLSGSLYVHVVMVVRFGGSDYLAVSTSTNGGLTFLPIQPVTAAFTSGVQVSGVAVDMQSGEIHVAWCSDIAGQFGVHYRRGIVDFFGNLSWLEFERSIHQPTVGDVEGAPLIQVGGNFAFTGASQRYVGIAWRQDDADGTHSLHMSASSDNGLNFAPEVIVAHTDDPGVDVAAFDFEIVSSDFVVVWQDNAESDGVGGVTVPTPAGSQVWRAESIDGVSFPDVQQLSAQSSATSAGLNPRIARTVGIPDGTAVAFIECDGGLMDVNTAYADQEFGGGWHDEYPRVSMVGAEGSTASVLDAEIAYNALYNNFIVVWRQESTAGSGNFDLMVAGYRPQEAHIIDWYQGSTTWHFEIGHLPFQDAYGFVLISLGSDNAPSGNTTLADGRKLGIYSDGVLNFGLSNFQFFVGVNDPVMEGVVTPLIPFQVPVFLPVGFEISFAAASWGPFGEFHVVTDAFRAPLEAPPAP